MEINFTCILVTIDYFFRVLEKVIESNKSLQYEHSSLKKDLDLVII